MAENNNNDFETFKIRIFTNIPQKTVLVGDAWPMHNPKIFTKHFLHFPWFKSRFISLKNNNKNLLKEKFQLNGEGLEIVSDVAINYEIEPFLNEKKQPYGIVDRWKSFINAFNGNRRKVVRQYAKIATIGLLTVGATLIIGPFSLLIPALSAGYISIVYQDPDYIKKQGIYKYAFNNGKETGIVSLEQKVYEALKNYYARHSYEEIKGKKIDFKSSEFDDVRAEFESVRKRFGIIVTDITETSADLTPESDALLRKKKEAEMEAEAIRQKGAAEADAKRMQADADLYASEKVTEAIVARMKASGISPEKYAEILKYAELGKNGNAKTVVVDDPSEHIRRK